MNLLKFSYKIGDFNRIHKKWCKNLLLPLRCSGCAALLTAGSVSLHKQTCWPPPSSGNLAPVGSGSRWFSALQWHPHFSAVPNWHPTENLKNECFTARTCGWFSLSKLRQKCFIQTALIFSKPLVFVLVIALLQPSISALLTWDWKLWKNIVFWRFGELLSSSYQQQE